MSSVETLGSTTVVCTDKTGTLTAGEMTAAAVRAGRRAFDVTGVGYAPEGTIVDDGQPVQPATAPAPLASLLLAAIHCNNARLVDDEERGWMILGDPTEGALLVLARKAGLDVEAELRRTPRLHEIPFDSQRKRMSVVDQERGLDRVWAKGASSEIVPRCTRIADDDGERLLTDDDRRSIEREVDELAGQGLRVLAFATRELPPGTPREADEVERDLVFLGLVGLQDPPRPEVTAAVADAHSAGVAIVMITGDYGLTAEAIARKIGIVTEPHPETITERRPGDDRRRGAA